MLKIGSTVLSNGCLILRPWQQGDEAYLYDLGKWYEVARWSGTYPRASVEESYNVLVKMIEANESFAVVLPEYGHPVGNFEVGEDTKDSTGSTALIGYSLHPHCWGNGIMPMCINMVLRWLFCNYSYNRVKAVVYDGNYRSARVLEKCGFERVATSTLLDRNWGLQKIYVYCLSALKFYNLNKL